MCGVCGVEEDACGKASEAHILKSQKGQGPSIFTV